MFQVQEKSQFLKKVVELQDKEIKELLKEKRVVFVMDQDLEI
jgi:hypothetical protein